MFDIHTHILPNVDDGSKNIELSIELIKQEIDFGVTDLFLTPHYMKIRNYISTYSNNMEIFEDLKKEVENQNLKINLHLGNEIYATNMLLSDLKTKKIVPLGDTKFVLVEFAMGEEDYEIGETINNLVVTGYIPIIAHPERYQYFKSLKDYKIIKKMGAYIQVNAGSFFGIHGRFAKKMAFQLVKNGYCDFIASDVHDFRGNYLLEAYKLINKKFTEEVAKRLFANPILFRD